MKKDSRRSIQARHISAWAGICLFGWVGAAMAGRPLITNDANTLEPRQVQIEAGATSIEEAGQNHWSLPLVLTYGLLPRVEVAIGSGMWFDELATAGVQVDDLVLGFKWRLLDQEKALVAQAISVAVGIPTAAEESGQMDYDVTWILTHQFGERTSLLFNVGNIWLAHHDNGTHSNLLHYGPALTYQLTAKLQPVAEVVFETPVEGGQTSAGFNGGIRYQFLESLMFDAAMGAKVAGDWPTWTATIGLTWVF